MPIGNVKESSRKKSMAYEKLWNNFGSARNRAMGVFYWAVSILILPGQRIQMHIPNRSKSISKSQLLMNKGRSRSVYPGPVCEGRVARWINFRKLLLMTRHIEPLHSCFRISCCSPFISLLLFCNLWFISKAPAGQCYLRKGSRYNIIFCRQVHTYLNG